MILFALVAATVPIAALDERRGSQAVAADSAPKPSPQPQGPPAPPPPPPPISTRIQWRDSIAHGTANVGWLERGVILPEDGPGFYTYYPYTQTPPNRAERRHGTALLVREVVAMGEWWQATFPDAPRLGIGDLSIEGGGSFDLHASHENGLDVDIRLPRADGTEGQSNPSNYDQALTQSLVDYLVGRGAEYVFYGPNLDVGGPGGRVTIWPNHDDHLHVRFPDPDGRGN
jgi:Penicillin-insensitive murein endopeptidase